MFGEPVPKFRAIIETYKLLILGGKYKAGDQLPTVREVAKSFGVAHNTAARAMAELQTQGFAEVVGRSTVVVDRGRARVTGRIKVDGKRTAYGVSWAPDPTPLEFEESREVVVPPAYINRAFRQPAGVEVVRRESVRKVGGRPARLAVWWFPAELVEVAPALMNQHYVYGQLATALYEIVLSGRGTDAGILDFHVRTADEREARMLDVAVGSPVMGSVETYGDSQGAVAYVEHVYPPGVSVMLEFLDALDSDDHPDGEGDGADGS